MSQNGQLLDDLFDLGFSFSSSGEDDDTSNTEQFMNTTKEQSPATLAERESTMITSNRGIPSNSVDMHFAVNSKVSDGKYQGVTKHRDHSLRTQAPHNTDRIANARHAVEIDGGAQIEEFSGDDNPPFQNFEKNSTNILRRDYTLLETDTNGTKKASISSYIPDEYLSIFPYANFNRLQSAVVDVVFNSPQNVVVASPTGSGKTAVLEIAIVRNLHLQSSQPIQSKIVYIAPLKALCLERANDWKQKFERFNLNCGIITGDTEQREISAQLGCSILFTTPEKWDSMTRRWKDKKNLLGLVSLVLIDEIHLLSEDRGPTLEAVVTRMKLIS